jgi:hypothetical protein
MPACDFSLGKNGLISVVADTASPFGKQRAKQRFNLSKASCWGVKRRAATTYRYPSRVLAILL